VERSATWVLAIALVVSQFGAPAAYAADEVVLDNSSPFVQVSGAWTSNALTPGFTGSDYLFRPASSGDATVFWPFPAAANGGRYDVFARWTSGPNRATNALYWIASEAGTVPVTRNQQHNGGSWQPLGSFEFKPGRSQGVTLSDRADGVVIADSLRWVGPLAADAPPPAPAPTPTPALDLGAAWTVALDTVDLHAGPDARTDVLARLPQFSYLQVQGYAGDWAYVYNPRARGTAYLPSRLLGPSDVPPSWVTAPPPPSIGSVEQVGRTVGGAAVAFYPVDDKFAYVARLGHNERIVVHDRVRGLDGSTWYRVDNGYLAEGAVRLPAPPERTYRGRWIDADLREPAMLVAYEGDTPVMSTLVIKGRIATATPTGVFEIGRRVEDETMDSSTLGIPNDSPDGYKLEHVLYTQYFTADGASIHYNYWSSNFGYSGSHGCLGVDRAASEFLWGWADYGTPVVIHS
jgi:hypothetical protein